MEDARLINDYFLIGDLHSAALVCNGGSIDWLCWPHFDSPSLFGKLLDDHAGSFSIGVGGARVASSYIKDSAIVEHQFTGKKCDFVVHDFMVPQAAKKCERNFLVRKIVALKGKPEVTFIFDPQPNYARDKAENVSNANNDRLQFSLADDSLILHLPPRARVFCKGSAYYIEIVMAENETVSLVMEYIAGHSETSHKSSSALEAETAGFWKAWLAQGHFFDFCRDEMIRSAITLKLMQFYPTGAIVAAPTTSLPEQLGAVRNWDYRFVWIRDATFSLYALSVLGYDAEAELFFDFIQNIVERCRHEDFDVSLMYTIDGTAVPQERILRHLSGYKNSRPVRIGNAAARQFQLDVYGALIDAYYFAHKKNLEDIRRHKDLICSLADKISKVWQKKDSGMWEVRSGPQHFTYSKVMAWAGVDRLLRMQSALELSSSDKLKYERLEEQIRRWIWKHCYDEDKQVLRQHPGTEHQDATNFLLVLLQFLDKHEERTRRILENTRAELGFKDVFVYRYFTPDGLPDGEGAFLLCSFWMIAAWAILERTDYAQKLFYELESHFADHRLLSEEIDAATGEYLGNYPQAFSHLGYILSAYYIDRYKRKKKNNS